MQQDAAEAADIGIDAFVVQFTDPTSESMLETIFQGAMDPTNPTNCKIKVAIMFGFDTTMRNGPSQNGYNFPMQYLSTGGYSPASVAAIYTNWSGKQW